MVVGDVQTNECLTRLRIPHSAVTSYRNIATGGSGAMVSELSLGEQRFVLKFTRVDAKKDTYLNAQRELSFYRRISSLLGVRVPDLFDSFEDDYGICLLLRSYRSTPHPCSWPRCLA